MIFKLQLYICVLVLLVINFEPSGEKRILLSEPSVILVTTSEVNYRCSKNEFVIADKESSDLKVSNSILEFRQLVARLNLLSSSARNVKSLLIKDEVTSSQLSLDFSWEMSFLFKSLSGEYFLALRNPLQNGDKLLVYWLGAEIDLVAGAYKAIYEQSRLQFGQRSGYSMIAGYQKLGFSFETCTSGKAFEQMDVYFDSNMKFHCRDGNAIVIGGFEGRVKDSFVEVDLTPFYKHASSSGIVVQNGERVLVESSTGRRAIVSIWGLEEQAGVKIAWKRLEYGCNYLSRTDSAKTPEKYVRQFDLAQASRFGSGRLVRALLDIGHSVKSTSGRYPLLSALDAGHVNKCKILIEAGADPLIEYVSGNSVLKHFVVCRQQPLSLMQRKSAQTIVDSIGTYSDIEVLSALGDIARLKPLSGSTDLSGQEDSYYSPIGNALFVACRESQLDVISFLLGEGWDWRREFAKQNCFIKSIKDEQFLVVERLLIELGDELSAEDLKVLIEAARMNSRENVVRVLYQAYKLQSDRLLCEDLAYWGKIQRFASKAFIKYLARLGEQFKPWLLARAGLLTRLKLKLNKADTVVSSTALQALLGNLVRAKGTRQATAEYLDVLKLILEKRGKVRGQTLVRAISLYEPNVLRLLVRYTDDLDDTDNAAYTALFWAVAKGWPDGIRILLEAGASPNILPQGTKTLHDCAPKDKPEISELLEELGVSREP